MLEQAEHIIDVTDTGFSRRVELNIPEKATFDGANWLKEEGDPLGADISVWIEKNFSLLLLSTFLVRLSSNKYTYSPSNPVLHFFDCNSLLSNVH